MWCVEYAAMVLMSPLLGMKHYTNMNLLLLLSAMMRNKHGRLLEALAVNFTAINMCFHMAQMEDDKFFENMAKRMKMGMRTWYVADACGHVIPWLYALYMTRRSKPLGRMKRMKLATTCAMINLLWAWRISKNKKKMLDLSEPYVMLKNGHDSWKRLWMVAILGHYVGAALLP